MLGKDLLSLRPLMQGKARAKLVQKQILSKLSNANNRKEMLLCSKLSQKNSNGVPQLSQLNEMGGSRDDVRVFIQ